MKRMADDPLSIFDTIKDIYEYFDAVTERLRENPTEDLASYIANGKINGEHLPFRELISYYTIVATAGHDTTRNAITGGMHALITNPDQLARFKEIVHDEDKLKLAVEELIRWTTPVVQFSRTAQQDYELRGKTIKQGEAVGLMYASGSFDEDMFDDPMAFNIERKPNRHLAFGTGPHQCLGLLLARLEMRLFFEQLIPRIAEIELVGSPERMQASFVHGIKHLNIRYRLTE
jgi:cytochrome P450